MQPQLSDATVKSFLLEILQKETSILYQLHENQLLYIMREVFKVPSIPPIDRHNIEFLEFFAEQFIAYLKLHDYTSLKYEVEHDSTLKFPKKPNLHLIIPKNIIEKDTKNQEESILKEKKNEVIVISSDEDSPRPEKDSYQMVIESLTPQLESQQIYKGSVFNFENFIPPKIKYVDKLHTSQQQKEKEKETIITNQTISPEKKNSKSKKTSQREDKGIYQLKRQSKQRKQAIYTLEKDSKNQQQYKQQQQQRQLPSADDSLDEISQNNQKIEIQRKSAKGKKGRKPKDRERGSSKNDDSQIYSQSVCEIIINEIAIAKDLEDKKIFEVTQDKRKEQIEEKLREVQIQEFNRLMEVEKQKQLEIQIDFEKSIEIEKEQVKQKGQLLQQQPQKQQQYQSRDFQQSEEQQLSFQQFEDKTLQQKDLVSQQSRTSLQFPYKQINQDDSKELQDQQQRQVNSDSKKEIAQFRHQQREKETYLYRQREPEQQKQNKKEIELQKQKEIELQKQKEIELQKQKDKEKAQQIELEKQKQKELEIQKQKEKELEKEKEKERQKQLQLEKQIEKEKQKELKKQKKKEKEQEKREQKILKMKEQALQLQRKESQQAPNETQSEQQLLHHPRVSEQIQQKSGSIQNRLTEKKTSNVDDVVSKLSKLSFPDVPIEKPLCTPQLQTPLSVRQFGETFFQNDEGRNDCSDQKQQQPQIKHNQPKCFYCLKYSDLTVEIDPQNRICNSCLVDQMNPFSTIQLRLGLLQYKFSKDHSRSKPSLEFVIDQKYFDQRQNYQIEIRCVMMNKYGLSDITFPNACHILINNRLLKEIKPLLEKSCLKKRKDAVINYNLSEFFTMYGSIRRYTLSVVTIAPDPKMRQEVKDSYYFGVYIVKVQTPKNIIAILKSQNDKQSDSWQKSSNQQSEVAIDKTKVSLICQYSLQLMEIPARGSFCHHFQCYSLDNYLQMMYGAEHKKWICPLCKRVSFSFCIDKYQMRVLQRIKQLDLLVDQIVLNLEGKMDEDDELSKLIEDQSITTYQQAIDKGYNFPSRSASEFDEEIQCNNKSEDNSKDKSQQSKVIVID